MGVSIDGDGFVSLAIYNARGQTTMIVYGNGLMSRCAYEPLTYRLARVRSERYNLAGLDFQPTGAPLEDRIYAYDLVGNVLGIQDRTPGSGVLANPAAFSAQDPMLAGLLAAGNALVRQFGYDPSYRLVSATGRECGNIPAPRPVTDDRRCGYNSGSFGTVSQDNAPSMTALYTETYSYDPIGDLVTLSHQTAAETWTRDYGFGGMQSQDWQAACAAHLNTGPGWTSPPATQLTHLSNDPAAGVPVYSYDPNGNLTGITASRHLDWTHADRLGCYRTQYGSGPASMSATYLYDTAGTRIKKLVTRGSVVESTVYIDGLYESFRQTRAAGTIEQNTLHVSVGAKLVATIRVGTPLAGDATPATKYVFGDQLGTAAIVIDDTGGWVNREEFSPYGETLLGSFAHKRYRFAGRERDEESGFDYSRARYYAPWLARWITPDPLTVESLKSNLNPYVYVNDQPISAADLSGLDDPSAATSASSGASHAPKQDMESGGAAPGPHGGKLIEYDESKVGQETQESVKNIKNYFSTMGQAAGMATYGVGTGAVDAFIDTLILVSFLTYTAVPPRGPGGQRVAHSHENLVRNLESLKFGPPSSEVAMGAYYFGYAAASLWQPGEEKVAELALPRLTLEMPRFVPKAGEEVYMLEFFRRDMQLKATEAALAVSNHPQALAHLVPPGVGYLNVPQFGGYVTEYTLKAMAEADPALLALEHNSLANQLTRAGGEDFNLTKGFSDFWNANLPLDVTTPGMVARKEARGLNRVWLTYQVDWDALKMKL